MVGDGISYFIEIGQVGKLAPEASHYVLKLAELGRVAFPLSLDDGRSQSCRGIGRQKLINFHWSVMLSPTYPCNRSPFDQGIHCYRCLWARREKAIFLKGSKHFFKEA